MKKPGILIIGKQPPDYGGVSAVTTTMLQSTALAKQYELSTLNTAHTDRYAETEKRTIRLTYLRRRAALLFRLCVRVLTDRPTLVHYHTGGDLAFLGDALNLFVLKLMGRKVIMHYHTNPDHPLTAFPPRTGHRLRLCLFRQVVNRCDLFLVLGETYRRYVSALPGVRKQKVRALHNAAPAFLRSAPDHQDQHSTPGPLRVLYLGRLSRQKGFYDVVTIAALCRERDNDVQFLVAGTANSPDDELTVASLKASGALHNVALLGQVVGKAKEDLLASCDVLFVPSQYEGFPVSILEAALRGVPSIVYDTGMMREIVVDRVTGRILRLCAVDDALAAIIHLAAERAECRRFGEAARRRAQDVFGQAQFEARLLDIYAGLIGGKRQDPAGA